MNNILPTDQEYFRAMDLILTKGDLHHDRTGVGTKRVFGEMFKFDTLEELPIITCKRAAFKNTVAELLWFLSGSTNVNDLAAIRKPVEKWWRPFAINKEGDLGPMYGRQLRNFNGQGVDQVKTVIYKLKEEKDSRRILMTTYNPVEADLGALYPCFTPGHLVRVKGRGLTKIEEVEVQDLVEVEGGLFRPVTQVFKTPVKKDKKIISFNTWYSSKNIEATPEHPFLTKRGWVKAKDLTKNDFLAIDTFEPSTFGAPATVELYKNQYESSKYIKEISVEDMWVLGYFLGDGWTEANTNKVCFSISDKHKDRILPKIRNLIKINFTSSSGASGKYMTINKGWSHFLSQFGYKATGKKIPDWIFSMRHDYIASFIDGYCEADGYLKEGLHRITTVSPYVAYGIQKLGLSIQRMYSVQYNKKEPKRIIQGRLCNQSDTYVIEQCKNQGQAFAVWEANSEYKPLGLRVWFPIKELEITTTEESYVYNLEVKENHTYTVNNFVTHNCHGLLTQFMIDSKDRLHMSTVQRSADLGLGLPHNWVSYAVLLHMFANVCGLIPGELTYYVNDLHLYTNHINPMKNMELKSYSSPIFSINIKLDIDEYVMEDFDLIDYKAGPKINLEMAI